MPNVLVVDDDKIVPMLLEAKLQGTGIDVISSYNANEALKLACSSKRPELILLDLNMPKVSGLDLLETLKSNPELRNVPVIVITASQNQDKINEVRKLGAKDVIQKPIDGAELFQKVSFLLKDPE